ncbi:MAG TPA: class I SAM-dependent methyltransferase [Pyrinomonadaceae bacterium]|jgi:SAM-dependent methyltransferase
MNLPTELRCVDHQQHLTAAGGEQSSELICESGCRVPLVKGIPRFVSSENYASAFGIQWNAFKKTLLDSYNGTTIFRDRLTGCLGGSLDVVRGKRVLEVGCGAGPFTEVLLSAGAFVFASDLSNAVEANQENCGQSSSYFVCQADLRHLPVQPAAFDVVLCLGVVQHTPDPEATIAALAGYVKPGGLLVIDHYGPHYPYPISRRILRPLLLLLPSAFSTRVTLFLARALLRLHKLTWNQRRGVWRLRRFLQNHSPLVDHFDDFPQLGTELLGEWSVVNTHDTLTDRYKHLRSVEEIANCLAACGLIEIEAYYGGNGVEARARTPLVTAGAKA